MFRSVVRSAVRRIAPLAMAATALATPLASSPTVNTAATLPIPHPLISEALFLKADANPPTQADCNSVSRRCFNPAAMANSYNYAALHALGHRGQGKTIAVVDSFGSSTIRQDLAVFNNAFGLPQLSDECSAALRHHPGAGWSGAGPSTAKQWHGHGGPQPLGSRSFARR